MRFTRILLMMVISVALMPGIIESARAMSLFHHDNHGSPTQNLVTNGTSTTNNNGGTTSLINANPVTVTPEPSTVVLLASGLLGVGIWRLRQKS